MVKGEDGEVVLRKEEHAGDGHGLEKQPPSIPTANPCFPPSECCTRPAEWLSRVFLAATLPRFAQVVEKGCGPHNPIFSGPCKAQYTLGWCIGRLFPCEISINGEGNGKWPKEQAKGAGGGLPIAANL